MIVVGIVGYTDSPQGLRTFATVWASHLSDEAKRRSIWDLKLPDMVLWDFFLERDQEEVEARSSHSPVMISQRSLI